MAPGRTFTIVLMVGAILLGGCSDDDGDDPVAITREQYDEEAQRLCDQHGAVFTRGFAPRAADSDAEEAAFYRSDLIPRVRALVRRLAELGFPPEEDARYREAFNQVLESLDQLSTETFQYIEDRHNGVLAPGEDLLVVIQEALADADVPC